MDQQPQQEKHQETWFDWELLSFWATYFAALIALALLTFWNDLMRL